MLGLLLYVLCIEIVYNYQKLEISQKGYVYINGILGREMIGSIRPKI